MLWWRTFTKILIRFMHVLSKNVLCPISRHSKQNGIGGLRKKIALEHLNSIETKTTRFLN